MKKKEWKDAIAACEEALRRYPGDEHVKNSLSYVLQESIKDAYATQGPEKGRDFADSLLRPHGPRLDVTDTRGLARSVVLRLRDSGEFAEALAAVDQYADRLGS